jgi:hypothetical protein
LDQHGSVSTRLAGEVGVPAIELRTLSAPGGLTNIASSFYRVDDIPDDHCDPYLEPELRVGRDTYLMGEPVLAVHHPGVVDPAWLRVGAPRWVRAQRSPAIEVRHAALAPSDGLVEVVGPTW